MARRLCTGGVARLPFCLFGVEGSEGSTFCIDEDSGLVVDADGTADDFFDAEGNLSPATKPC